ncbi:MAG: hypothetical protein ACR2LL_13790 [Nitrosopumilus sp.]
MTNEYKKCPFCDQGKIPQKIKICKCRKGIEKIRYIKDLKTIE